MIAKALLYLIGYKVDPKMLTIFDKQVVGIFPHTSFFESGILCLAAIAYGFENRLCFACAEQYIDFWATGWWLKYFGGFAVRKGTGVTKAISEYLIANPDKFFAISPEGSLSYREWQKGFFYIAQATKAPIIIWGVDFSTHTITVAPGEFYINEGDDPEVVIPKIKEAFANCGIAPLHPECSNPSVKVSHETKTSMIPLRGKLFITSLVVGVISFIIRFW